jgi:hypothetical protein
LPDSASALGLTIDEIAGTVTVRLYHIVYEPEDAEAILRDGFQDRPLYPAMQPEGQNPSGVHLTDDPILSYEHVGSVVLRVDLNVTDGELLPFEDLDPAGFMFDTQEFMEDAWVRTRIPHIGMTRRDWLVPAEWLRPRVQEIEIVSEDPEDLWQEVARRRRPRPDAPQDPLNKRLAILARAIHGRPFDWYWDFGERYEDKRPGTIAVQESMAVFHFERLVKRLIEMDVPLQRCGWLLAEAARRVAVESLWIAKHLRQKRAAKRKSHDARAQDIPEVVREAERLAQEGVPVAQIRRRLLAKFGPDKVPSERVIRSRWLRHVRIPRR